jgi:hypothetical protein
MNLTPHHTSQPIKTPSVGENVKHHKARRNSKNAKTKNEQKNRKRKKPVNGKPQQRKTVNIPECKPMLQKTNFIETKKKQKTENKKSQ